MRSRHVQRTMAKAGLEANGQDRTEAGGAKGGAFTLDNTTTGAEALPRHTESPTSDAQPDR